MDPEQAGKDRGREGCGEVDQCAVAAVEGVDPGGDQLLGHVRGVDRQGGGLSGQEPAGEFRRVEVDADGVLVLAADEVRDAGR